MTRAAIEAMRPPDLVSPAGERLWFSGDGSETTIRALVPAGCGGPPLHRHLRTEETVTVVSGRIRYHLDGQVRVLEAGDSIDVPRRASHRFENPYTEEAEIVGSARPGVVHEMLLRLLAGAFSRRPPNPLEVAVAFCDGDGYPAEIPVPIARALFTVLRSLSEAAGVAGRFRAAQLPGHLLATRPPQAH
jgi:mannose-6-phosphate isomerase-like protein (cupin superfamily)